MGSGFLDVLHPLDVSAGGMSLAVPHGFEACDISGEIEVLIKLPKARPFVVKAIVRHRGGSGDKVSFGLEFKDLSEPAHDRIAAYVELLASQGRPVY
jgi:hypothetical protein